MSSNQFVLIVLLLMLMSCVKEISIDLNDSNPRLVIEANYIASDSSVIVLISKTNNYFEPYVHAMIDNATVTIWQEDKTPVVVPYVTQGRYELSGFVPEYGKNYTVKVVYDQKEYIATSHLRSPLTLLEPSLEYLDENAFFTGIESFEDDTIPTDGYWIYYRFQDAVGIGDCYKLIYTHKGKRHDKFGQFQVGSDELTDGKLFERPILKLFPKGDTVILELQTINRNTYDYYSQLSDALSGSDLAVGNPNYCWSNAALGYFSAYGYDQKQVVLPE